ncbi:hypothetical protein, partial [Limnobacter sp. UBA3528]|uniref:hypothetical protein n=1 Tax=Limnobacter sp. UBA3528 TaxID=1946760 RepID=UPI0025BD36D5
RPFTAVTPVRIRLGMPNLAENASNPQGWKRFFIYGCEVTMGPNLNKAVFFSLAVIALPFIQGCAVASATVGAAISITGAVVSTGIKVTGAVVEAGIDAVSDDDEELDE